MRQLTEKKKLEILRLFLEGYSYEDISAKSEVAKGTVVNAVNDFKNGRFPAFTDVADLVDVLPFCSLLINVNTCLHFISTFLLMGRRRRLCPVERCRYNFQLSQS